MLGFPRMRGTILGVPIIRIMAFLGLSWGPRSYGNCHRSGVRLGLNVRAVVRCSCGGKVSVWGRAAALRRCLFEIWVYLGPFGL